MGRKYIGQVNNQNFVYPNYDMTEYDVEIVHDINNNCITGTVTSFSATTISSSSISFTYNGSYNFNGAEPFKGALVTPITIIPYLSVHCQVPGQTYMNTWRVVDSRNYSVSTPPTTGSWTGDSFTITPATFGLSSFTTGTYFFEFRFIAEKCLYKICTTLNVTVATPTPTPTPTSTPTPTAGPITSTPTPTPTGTPTPTPTGPTATPTSTPTITPTPVCSCYFHNAIIGQADLNAATGNTLTFRNNKVYTGYFDCNGNEAFKQYDTAGTYTNDLCPNGIPVNVYYWVNDSATPASVSSVVNTGVCCTVPTPTPTATNTPTPTATFTPTPTATPAPIGQCYCYEIWVTGTTSGEGTIASIEYNDCFGTLTARAFSVGPLIYKQCIQTVSGVVQLFASNGIDESKIVIPGTGNCNTGFDCSGTSPIPATPTPTPTPTATGVPPTNTPTPTPTATSAPITATPTPTPTVVSYEFYIGPDYATALNACNNFDTDPQTPVYAAASTPNAVTQFFTDLGLTTTFTGSNDKYCWAPSSNLSNKWVGNVSGMGNTSSVNVCP
jgi:hypothetical protein